MNFAAQSSISLPTFKSAVPILLAVCISVFTACKTSSPLFLWDIIRLCHCNDYYYSSCPGLNRHCCKMVPVGSSYPVSTRWEHSKLHSLYEQRYSDAWSDVIKQCHKDNANPVYSEILKIPYQDNAIFILKLYEYLIMFQWNNLPVLI